MEISKKSLHKNLKRIFGFNSFRRQQEQIIINLLDGKDSMVIMPTGGGKSMCYQLPALLSEGCAIVVSPLIALMKNQVDSIRSYASNPNIAHFYNSSLSKEEKIKVKETVLSGKTKLLFVAPETISKENNIDFFKKCGNWIIYGKANQL